MSEELKSEDTADEALQDFDPVEFAAISKRINGTNSTTSKRIVAQAHVWYDRHPRLDRIYTRVYDDDTRVAEIMQWAMAYEIETDTEQAGHLKGVQIVPED